MDGTRLISKTCEGEYFLVEAVDGGELGERGERAGAGLVGLASSPRIIFSWVGLGGFPYTRVPLGVYRGHVVQGTKDPTREVHKWAFLFDADVMVL